MAQGGAPGGGGGGPDFHLPDEILAVIPTDPYDQLDLAKRITAMAIASRVSRLEDEAERLREKLSDRDRVIEELEDKLTRLDRLFQESDARLRASIDENAKLSKERDTLALTSMKLARDLAKLETFKKHLMQSLSDDSLPQQSEAVDTRDLLWKDGDSISHAGFDTTSEVTEAEGSKPNGLNQARHKFTITPYATPRLSPTGTPKGSSSSVFSTGASPKGFSTAGSSPRVSSGTVSPAKSRFDGYGSVSSLYPSSQQSSTNSSPPHRRSFPGRNPRIDGKELFRQARTRLSYEQFAAFLANVKELNAQRQSREETLAKAEEIFGIENKDLYLSFQGLLNRNIP